MKKKFKALLDNKTWIIVPFPSSKKTIGYKWFFRVIVTDLWISINLRLFKMGLGKGMSLITLRLSHQKSSL